jgi:hypothetical protein
MHPVDAEVHDALSMPELHELCDLNPIPTPDSGCALWHAPAEEWAPPRSCSASGWGRPPSLPSRWHAFDDVGLDVGADVMAAGALDFFSREDGGEIPASHAGYAA